MEEVVKNDDPLSRALLPEVWDAVREEAASNTH
jgi:hypothetical protein